MGYTDTSPHGGPVFVKSPPQTVLDLNRLRAYAESIGNTKTGTTSERTGSAGADVWEGLLWLDTDLDILFLYDGTGWNPIAGVPATGSLGHAGSVTPVTAIEYLDRDHRGRVRLYWSGTYTPAPLVDGSVIGTVPLGFRPAATYEATAVASVGGGGPCIATISAAGAITVFSITAIGAKKVSFFAEYPAAT